MIRRERRPRLSRVVVLCLATLLLTACGGSGSDDPPLAPPPTLPPVATATPGTLASPATSNAATPIPAATLPVASPPPDQAYVSDRADLGPLQWTAMVDPVTLAPIQPVATFPPSASTIYAVVPVRQVAAGTVISSTWTYNDTAISGVGSSVTVPEAIAGVWLEFHLARTSVPAWPDGTYAVVIQVDDQPALSSSVQVDDA